MTPRRVKIWTLVCALVSGAGCQAGESPQAPQARWHNNQGVVYMDQHNYSRGRDEFNRAVALDPRYANGFANLGIAYYSLGKYDSALVALHSALKQNADHAHAQYTLGLIYLAQGKEYEKALQAFSAVLKRDSDDPLVHYYLGRAKEKLGQAEEAAASFRQAIRLDPHNVSAYYALAQLLRQQGKQEEFQQVLGTFNQLQQAGNEGVSSSYQGQGKYAEVVTDAGGVAAVRDDAKTPLVFAAAEGTPGGWRFASVVDADQDGDQDLLAGGEKLLFLRNEGGRFAPLAGTGRDDLSPFFVVGSGDPAQPFQDGVFADFDNDQDPDLVLAGAQTLLLRGDPGGTWGGMPVGIAGPSTKAIAADVDHDGDLDLLLLSAGATQLLSNDGTGKFAEIGAKTGLGSSSGGRQAVFADFDNDRDVDFVVATAGAGQLFTNNRDGTFSDMAGEMGLAGLDAVDLWVEDFDQDSYMDLAALSPAGQLSLLLNQHGRSFAAQPALALQGEGRLLCGADFDNDGDQDLLAGGAWGLQPLVWRGGKLQAEGTALQAGAGPVLAADFDGDGRADIWAAGQLWRNQTQAGKWIQIALQGLNSNRSGLGTKVEVKTTHRLQKRELRGSGRDTPVLSFGLAGSDSVEFVRILWPGGVRQTELATGAGQRLSLTELNRKGTSCPILYAWDGEEFRFVTDILGGAIIGYLLAPGQYYPPDSDEYVPLGSIAPLNGKYELRIANQLEEIIYLDQLQLVAVDHPEGLEVFPNERLLSAPPYPEFRLYPLRDLRPLRGVTDHQGRQVGPVLAAVDDEWYRDFGHTPIHGYAQEYSLTLDLGDLEADAHPVLVGYGWVDYAHSSSNWAAAQQGLELRPVRLEVPGPDGRWQVVTPDMGVPAGLPKHMLFDLKGLFTNGDCRLRLSTNTPVYWDQFLVGEAEEVALEPVRLQPVYGDLHWRGYPAHTAVKGTFAFRYHYDQLQTEADWGTHEGAFTRQGEVTELLQAADDRFAIMFHGDEVSVQFDAAALAPPAPGFRRSFFLYADGFGKDMDFHSAHSLTVGPLPFHGMSSYPYPSSESYPLDESHLRYLLEYNTRQVKGQYD